MAEKLDHTVTITCLNPQEPNGARRFLAQCVCGWRARGTGAKGEARVERRADAHLHGGPGIRFRGVR